MFNFSGAECNKRWTYVRDYYIRRRGKPNLGTSSQAARKRAQNLTFLDGITQKKRRACLECSHTSQENVSVSEEDENSRLETTEAEPVTLNSFEREASSPEPVTLNSFEPEASIDDIQEPDKKKRKLEVAEERLAILKELAENLRENSTDIKDANENDLFFAAMSKIVQKLPRSVQAQLRMDVANLIGNAEIKALSSTENSTSGIKYDDNFV
ncbi:unnamed protein product [Acanthoscelides obtectus]|uniref:BESS domain-containing protein n=1 Tax=Acanthoscelides obtectus TaxID=200917 RepID=A0A9P0JTX3_ACAOB|nr:unnamed protein product [Acanthoscelides obtectus]CAK1642902.1 hypothetical protein AOBTE_LOCUS13279 [Acanthoscelides obtectus]